MSFWILNKTNDSTAEMLLYGVISDTSWWGDEVTPKQFADDLKALGDVGTINVRINSAGGDVFAGVTIYNLLKTHSAKVNVYVDGLAASIASIIAMAGDRIIMQEGSMMMVHNPWTFAMGDSNDLRGVADFLDTVRSSLVNIYVSKTGLSNEEVIALLDAETWMTAQETVDAGFAHEVAQEVKVAACLRDNKTAIFNGVTMDWSKFINPPDLPTEQKPAARLPVAPRIEPPKPQNKNQGGQKIMNLEELKAQHPEIYAAAVKDGVNQERSRMKALDELSIPGHAATIAKAKYETGASAEQTAVAILNVENTRRKTMAQKMQDDSDESNMEDVDPEDSEDNDPKDEDDEETEAKALGKRIAEMANKKHIRGGVR
ncbi:head maturation protease, ClpP-related [Paenibacillus albiflavus]|nr:head maturation protease, ClpP-related [Paenibacillus albiflavus]